MQKEIEYITQQTNKTLSEIYSSDELYEKEMDFIDQYDPLNNGLNADHFIDKIIIKAVYAKKQLTLNAIRLLIDKEHYEGWAPFRFSEIMTNTVNYIINKVNQGIGIASPHLHYHVDTEYRKTKDGYVGYPVILGVNDFKSIRLYGQLTNKSDQSFIACAFFNHHKVDNNVNVEKMEKGNLELIGKYCIR